MSAHLQAALTESRSKVPPPFSRASTQHCKATADDCPSTNIPRDIEARERKVVQADIANHTAPRSTMIGYAQKVVCKPTFTKQAGTAEIQSKLELPGHVQQSKGNRNNKVAEQQRRKTHCSPRRHGLEFGRCGSEGIKGHVEDVRKQAQTYLKSANTCESLDCINQVPTLI